MAGGLTHRQAVVGVGMRAKYKFQVAQDTCLLFILLSLMGFHLWGAKIHEWLGVTFLLVIALHCGLNTHWFSRLSQGEYSPWRVLQLTLNTLLLLTFVTAIVSGVVLSRHMFYAFPFHHASDGVRIIHMTCVHWVQILAALHLGMHWKMLATFFCSVWRIRTDAFFARRIMPGLFVLATLYGARIFVSQDLLSYLLAQVDFSWFAYESSAVRFYLDYLAVVIAIAWLTRILVWALFFRKRPASNR